MDKHFSVQDLNGLRILQQLVSIYCPTSPSPADGAVFPTFKSAPQKIISFDGFEQDCLTLFNEVNFAHSIIKIAHRPKIEPENETAYFKHETSLCTMSMGTMCFQSTEDK